SYNVQSDLTRIKPDTLLFGTQYYWRMLAIHSKDTLYSAIRAFTTVVKPTLKTPANNSTNVQLTPSLTWGKISGVKTYELELASNSAFTGARHYNISATGGAGDELFKVPIHVLDSASTYFWRVKAISSRDSSAWSDTFNFRCVALGVEDPADLLGKANIFPSPAAGEVNIQMKSTVYGNAEVSVYDLLGKTRIERQVQITAGQIRNFDLENLPDGIYMINIKHEGVSATSKLIIRR
ncbi:MAG TPA: T9SS type A sorting domain-containing protein, partial [Lentimicrobium sp.]|nr:T9SS type A sorting domain-containing protein [Lentimicrobium sp.]